MCSERERGRRARAAGCCWLMVGRRVDGAMMDASERARARARWAQAGGRRRESGTSERWVAAAMEKARLPKAGGTGAGGWPGCGQDASGMRQQRRSGWGAGAMLIGHVSCISRRGMPLGCWRGNPIPRLCSTMSEFPPFVARYCCPAKPTSLP